MADREIVIKRTYTITTRVPFNDDYFPGMTEQEAIDYEYNMDEMDRRQWFSEYLESHDEDSPDTSLTMTQRIHGQARTIYDIQAQD